MKKFRYLLFALVAMFAAACTEDNVTPRDGEDDPIIIPPPKTPI
jgi:hypothetical protein